MPIVTTKNGRQWQVSSEGEGATVLFIHGWSVDSRIWAQQLQFFSTKFRVVAVDLPGHGATPWQDLPLSAIAQDFAGILAQPGCGPAHIVGSSFGGLVGIKLCELFPAQARSLVLVGSQPKFLQTDDYPWGLSKERLEKLRAQVKTDYPAIVPIFFRSLFTPKERASERFKWLQQFRKTDAVPSREALLLLLDRLCETDLRQALAGIGVPVQFINGTADPICPGAVYEYLQARMPSARFDWLEGCGHFPFVSRPAEFNALLNDFLKANVL
jgi:pimeloyl-ACP methyl ester esterase